MRILILILVALVIYSCNDNGVQEVADLKPVPGKIIVSDCTYKKPLENIKIELSYYLKKNTAKLNDLMFFNYPNPFYETSSFEFETMDPVKVEIFLKDEINEIEKKIVGFQAKAGFHSQIFSLSAYKDLTYPMLKAYLKFDSEMIDSTNILHLDATQSNILINKNLIYFGQLLSDKNGEINIPNNYKISFNQKFPIYNDKGMNMGYYEVLPAFHFLLINETSGKTTEYTINFSDIEEKGVILKAF